MLQWIADNKDWIFSGIGVTAISGLAAFIFVQRNKSAENEGKISQRQKGGSQSTNIQIGKVERRD